MSCVCGRRDSFDAVYGTSAGAINCTYFLTGQREGVDIYPEDIANKMFIDLRRIVGRDSGAPPPLVCNNITMVAEQNWSSAIAIQHPSLCQSSYIL